MATNAVSPIWTRKLDLCYLCFFFIHIPIMLGMLLLFLTRLRITLGSIFSSFRIDCVISLSLCSYCD
jgi:hypothetical protein